MTANLPPLPVEPAQRDERFWVIERAVLDQLRLYVLPANVATYHHEDDTHHGVALRCADLIAEAVVAALTPEVER